MADKETCADDVLRDVQKEIETAWPTLTNAQRLAWYEGVLDVYHNPPNGEHLDLSPEQIDILNTETANLRRLIHRDKKQAEVRSKIDAVLNLSEQNSEAFRLYVEDKMTVLMHRMSARMAGKAEN